nr:MAG: major capsid protein [Microviridae sp.]
MRNNKIGKISMGVDGVGINKFDLSFDANTTMEFGDVEPLFVHEMMANSKMRFKAENLTRLAPLVAPCFGRMKLHNYNMFVAKKDLFPLYDAWQAQKPIGTASSVGEENIPTQLPHIAANKLFANCFVGADYQFAFDRSAGPGKYVNGPFDSSIEWTYSTAIDGGRWADTIFVNNQGSSGISRESTPWLPDVPTSFGGNPNCYNLAWFIGRYANYSAFVPVERACVPAPAGNFHCASDMNVDKDPIVLIDKADYTFYGHEPGKTWTTATEVCAHSFRFSNYGRRFKKILEVCGYPLDAECTTEVSILPLMAYYRAYFELFGITLYKNWEQTACYKLIQRFRMAEPTFQNTEPAFVDLNALWYDHDSILWQFLRDLSNCWVSDKQDFVSANTENASGYGLAMRHTNPLSINAFLREGSRIVNNYLDQSLNARTDGSFGTGGSVTGAVSHTNQTGASGKYGEIYINRTNHSELDAKLLRKAYKYVNRQTILGQNIAKTLNAMGQEHYDEDVPCPFIGHTEVPLSVSDVTSLADTTASGGKGLGEFGGKSVGYTGGKSFKWTADVDGYWISMNAIIPEAGYCQSVDKTLMNLDKYACYQPDFERCGMVPTQKMQIVGNPYGSVQLQDFNREDMTLTDKYGDSPLSYKFGYVPRYTEYKVARNICGGDMNRGATMDTYAPYHLDKLIPIHRRQLGFDPTTGRTTNTIKSDCVTAGMLPSAGISWRFSSRYPWLSNFNRIFANVGQTPNNPVNGVNISHMTSLDGDSSGWSFDTLTQNDDNFICHNCVLVTYHAPMLPINESYETFEEEKGANGSTTKA